MIHHELCRYECLRGAVIELSHPLREARVRCLEQEVIGASGYPSGNGHGRASHTDR